MGRASEAVRMNKRRGGAVAAAIDHTLLRADTTRDDIRRLCHEALRFSFAAVCVNPVRVMQAAELLEDSGVAVATVCSFPLGAGHRDIKAAEARKSLGDGASEIDMVLNLGAAKSGHWMVVEEDIAAVVEAAGGAGGIVKVILECGLLTDAEKQEAARCAVRAGAGFVKTSTGMLGPGATAGDVALLRRVVGSEAKVKASGGIRDLGRARAMLAAGADRLGTSSGVAIVEEICRLRGEEIRSD